MSFKPVAQIQHVSSDRVTGHLSDAGCDMKQVVDELMSGLLRFLIFFCALSFPAVVPLLVCSRR